MNTEKSNPPDHTYAHPGVGAGAAGTSARAAAGQVRPAGKRAKKSGAVGQVRPTKTTKESNASDAHHPSSIILMPVGQVRPSPDNDLIYRPVRYDDPAFLDLVESIRTHGILNPIEVTRDGYIVSGHRRHAAARTAGLAVVPVIVNHALVGPPDPRTLVERNRQREKTRAEKLREAIATVPPAEAYRALRAYREARGTVDLPAMEIEGEKRRKRISELKRDMRDAVLKQLHDLKAFLPLTVRQLHYRLLNDPPLRNTRDRRSRYANTKQDYKDLCDLVSRLRLLGEIPWQAIVDETRPQCVWRTWPGPGSYVRDELDGLFRGYYRDLQQSQEVHVEIVGEKNTIQGTIQPVAAEFRIPLTIGRGYCSLQPRYAMAQRFLRSGRSKLAVLALSDFDPDGEEIAQSFARSLRDDFGIEDIHPVKVALTAEQVDAYGLPPQMKAKAGSAHHDKFVGRYGEDVFELESLPPAELQRILRDAIGRVIDVGTYDAELRAEERDAGFLEASRQVARDALAYADFDDVEDYLDGGDADDGDDAERGEDRQ